MHKTTINLRDDLHLRLRNLSEQEGKAVGELVNDLLSEALRARAGTAFESVGSGEADVADLGRNAEKYLREGLR